MPIVEMFVPQGTVDADAKRVLHEQVARQVLEVEGANYEESPRAREITWMLIHEMPEGSWSVGSEILSDGRQPRVLTRVIVPHGSLNERRQALVMARVHGAIVEALGADYAEPTRSICVIEENTFGGGGMVVSFAEIMRWLELKPEVGEPVATA